MRALVAHKGAASGTPQEPPARLRGSGRLAGVATRVDRGELLPVLGNVPDRFAAAES